MSEGTWLFKTLVREKFEDLSLPEGPDQSERHGRPLPFWYEGLPSPPLPTTPLPPVGVN